MKIKVVIAILLFVVLTMGQLPNCQTTSVTNPLKCAQCNTGFQLDDQGQCKFYTPIEGCLIYNSTSSSSGCFTCLEQYLLQNGYCQSLLPNCLKTTRIDTCDQCKQGYVLIRHTACLSTDTANCPQGTIPRTVNGVSYCQQYSATNCMLSYSGTGCQVCSTNFRILNGICLMITSNSSCPNNQCQCQGYYYQNNCYAITLPNCLQSADKIYCDLCADGYKIDKGTCVKFIQGDNINCNVLAPDGTRCSGCTFGHVLDPNYICVKNFSLCLGAPCTAATCFYSNFILYNGQCYSQDPLCMVYNFTQMICTLCEEGYAVNAVSRVCEKKVTCLSRGSNNLCNACFTGYQLDTVNLVCVKLPPNCVSMDVNRNLCLKCSSLTSFSSFGCIFPTSNCVTYNSYGRCQTCATGYVEVNRFCQPVVTNCQTFGSSQAVCSVCNQGYHLYQGQCYRDVEGCLSYSEKKFCSHCSSQYLTINGSCFKQDSNCLAQDISGACLGCQGGFIAAQGKCVYYDPFCMQYDANSSQCIRAAGGFNLEGFTFTQQMSYINFVMQAQSASNSSGSSSGLSSSGSGKSATGSFTSYGHILTLPYAGLLSPSIATYSFNGIILSCATGYTLYRDQCFIIKANCQNYSQYGNCLLCNPGYDLMANNSCSPRSSASCTIQSGGICSQAAPGFVVVEGSAVYGLNHITQTNTQNKIIAVQNGYFIWQRMGLAWPLDRNCQVQYEPSQCTTCNFGYTVLNGQCVIQKLNCVAYSSLGLCMGCQSQYILWAGECKPKNCISIDSTTGFCLTCQQGFSNRMGVCLPTTKANCQVYSGSKCSYCISSHYLTTSGLCSAMIPFCRTADPQTGRCLTCIDNYTYYSQQCIPLIVNCEVYVSSLNACSTCQTLYYPINSGLTCGYMGTNCLRLSSENNCAQCKSGFMLITQNTNQICVRNISNCIYYDFDANCVTCAPNYVLQYNNCKSLRCLNYIPPCCKTCVDPYVIQSGTCNCVDPNCLRHVGQICQLCKDGYCFVNGLCTTTSDPNCLVVDTNTCGCKQCKDQYVIGASGLCEMDEKYFNGCLTRQYPCPVCEVGFELRADGFCWAKNCFQHYDNRNCMPGRCYNDYEFDPNNGICRKNVYQCLRYDNNHVCLQCNNGYNLTSQGRCVADYCLYYNFDSYLCTTCISGYTLISRTDSCILQLPNCYLPRNSSYCEQCNSGYVQLQGKCWIIVPFCLNYNSQNGWCSICTNGYYLTANGQCQLLPVNCRRANSSGWCLECYQGYVLAQGQCIIQEPNCVQFNSNGQCSICQDGYYLTSNYKCTVLPSFCTSANPQGQCLTCLPNYSLSYNRCVLTIPFCVEYNRDDPSQCFQCLDNYYLTDQYRCANKPPNCQIADSNGVCIKCINTIYQLINGLCVIPVQNCLSYRIVQNINDTRCSRCADGYQLDDIKNVCQGNLPPHCVQGNNNRCQICASGWRLYQSICVREVNFCQVWNTTSLECSLCNSGYYLALNGSTSYFFCSILPHYCLTADLQGYCTTCLPNYSLSYNRCVLTIPFCVEYNRDDPSQCFQCLDNYYLTDQYRCANKPPNCQIADSNGVCIKCINTIYQLINGLCVIPVQNCLSYRIVQNINDTRCSRCADGYQLDDIKNVCQGNLPPHCVQGNNNRCQICASGWRLYQSICVREVNFCQVWNTTSLECSLCNSGYYLALNGSTSYFFCSILPHYCLTADLQGYCTTCLQGYSIYSGRCVDNTTLINCQVYNPSTMICTQCYINFQLINNRCVPKWCRTYTNANLCSECYSPYKLFAGICYPSIVNCLTYTNAGWCAQCMQGFTLSQDGRSCVSTDGNCVVYSPLGVCTRCRSGYDLVNNWCTILPSGCSLFLSANRCQCLPNYIQVGDLICVAQVQNCQTYNRTGCQLCQTSFYLWNNVCRTIPSFCSQYDPSTGRCLVCNSGYTLNQNTGTCSRGADTCASYDSQGRCIYCIARYYLYSGQCLQYPDYCVCVDLKGNCLSCAFGSQLRNGACVPTTNRNINCLRFDSINMICLQCSPGYSLCQATGLCLLPDPGCTKYSGSSCQECKEPYILRSGQCVLYPPGVILLQNGAIGCRDGYTQFNNSCLKTESTLTKVSTLPGQVQFRYSSGNLATSSFIGSNAYWTPSNIQINQYLSMTFTTTTRARIIFQLGIRGNPQGWVSGYVLYYRNRADGPFVCWNGCNMVAGNSDGSSTSWLKLYHPIVATEVRFYPVRWVGVMSMQTDMSLMQIQ